VWREASRGSTESPPGESGCGAYWSVGAARPGSGTGPHARDVGRAAPQWAVTAGLLLLAALVAAVGVTWYAPPKDPPGLSIRQGGTTRCGEVVSARRGTVGLKADGVETTVDLAQADSVTPVPTCRGTTPAP